MKGTQEELDELLSKYSVESGEGAIVVMLFEVLKEHVRGYGCFSLPISLAGFNRFKRIVK